MKRRRLKAVITKIRRRTVTMPAKTLRARCAICDREVEIFNVADAASILEVEEPSLKALILTGRIHAVQTVNDHLWICKDSLFQNKE